MITDTNSKLRVDFKDYIHVSSSLAGQPSEDRVPLRKVDCYVV